MAEKCKECGAILPRTIKVCRFCEGKKFSGAAKSLLKIVVSDVKKVSNNVKNVAAKARKIRIKIED